MIDSGTAAELISGSNEIAWGIWEFHPGMETVSSAQVVMTVPEGDEAWIALADYSLNTWAFHGPVSSGGSLDLIDDRHRSLLGNCCVAVISTGGDLATVQKVILTSESDWAIVTVDDGGTEEVGAYSSLIVVNDNPAICYSGSLAKGALKYVRAEDVEGANWGSPIVFADDYVVFTSMAMLDAAANPAICY